MVAGAPLSAIGAFRGAFVKIRVGFFSAAVAAFVAGFVAGSVVFVACNGANLTAFVAIGVADVVIGMSLYGTLFPATVTVLVACTRVAVARGAVGSGGTADGRL